MCQSLRFANHSVWLIRCKNFFDRIIVTSLDLVFFPESGVNGLENERPWTSIHTIVKVNENERYRSSITKTHYSISGKSILKTSLMISQMCKIAAYKADLWVIHFVSHCDCNVLLKVFFLETDFKLWWNLDRPLSRPISQLELIQNRVLKDCDHWK